MAPRKNIENCLDSKTDFDEMLEMGLASLSILLHRETLRTANDAASASSDLEFKTRGKREEGGGHE